MAAGTTFLRGGTVVDGTGAPAVVADVVLADGRIAAVGPDLAVPEGAEVVDCTGLRRGARLHRPPHPLRRPGPVGPRAHALVVARRHHRGGGQLRLRHRPDPARAPAHHPARAGERGGHAPRRAGGGHPLDLRDLPRVPRRRRAAAPRHQRRRAARPHPAAVLRARRRRHRAGGHRGRGRAHGAAGRRGDRRRCRGLLHLPHRVAPRRLRQAGAEPGLRPRRDPRPRRRAGRQGGAAPSSPPGVPTCTSRSSPTSPGPSTARSRGRH